MQIKRIRTRGVFTSLGATICHDTDKPPVRHASDFFLFLSLRYLHFVHCSSHFFHFHAWRRRERYRSDGACRGDETHWYRGVGKKNSKEQRNLGRSECRNCHRKDRPTDVASQPFTLPPFVLRENNFLRWAYDCYVVSGWEWILLVLIAREWFLRVKARTVVKISVNPLAKI